MGVELGHESCGSGLREHGSRRRAADRHETQYFEMFCNRGIYHKGWTAVTRHSIPWVLAPLPSFDEDVWELYDTTKDWSQAHDLAAELPEKLHELQRLWLTEAIRHDVLPLDDRRIERFDPDLAGRPQLVNGSSQMLFGGMGRLAEASLINVKNKSHAVTAQMEVPTSGADGVIIAQGGASGDVPCTSKAESLPTVTTCSACSASRSMVTSRSRQVSTRFGWNSTTTAVGLVRAARSPYIDGTQVGERRLPATVPLIFSADETADIGRDGASPVSDDYTPEGSVFTGVVTWVQIDLGTDDHDHLISPEERLRIAMARQ